MRMGQLASIFIVFAAWTALPAAIGTASAAKGSLVGEWLNMPSSVKGVPCPEAGVGISFILLGVGYVAFRRRRDWKSSSTPKRRKPLERH